MLDPLTGDFVRDLRDRRCVAQRVEVVLAEAGGVVAVDPAEGGGLAEVGRDTATPWRSRPARRSWYQRTASGFERSSTASSTGGRPLLASTTSSRSIASLCSGFCGWR
jgi:hypothetical protein